MVFGCFFEEHLCLAAFLRNICVWFYSVLKSRVDLL